MVRRLRSDLNPRRRVDDHPYSGNRASDRGDRRAPAASPSLDRLTDRRAVDMIDVARLGVEAMIRPRVRTDKGRIG